MAEQDPVWSYGKCKVVEANAFWSYGESVAYREITAVAVTVGRLVNGGLTNTGLSGGRLTG